MNHDAVREQLLETDREFRRIVEEHRDCECRLERISSNSLISQAAETESKRLKVHKLALKDRMESMIREHATPV